MISGSQEIEAFPISCAQVVMASRNVTSEVDLPGVQIMNLGGGIVVSGKDSVEALLRACLFALRREHEIE